MVWHIYVHYQLFRKKKNNARSEKRIVTDEMKAGTYSDDNYCI